ncbi:MAG: hypothetical protein MAG458_01480 [Nitrosopumilus sp.]|nr:hypothetical protein [Nitrosopumilus sp.]
MKVCMDCLDLVFTDAVMCPYCKCHDFMSNYKVQPLTENMIYE